MLKFAFAATVMVYHQSWLLQPTGVEYQPDLMANYKRGDPHGTSVPVAIFLVALVHLCARAQWRYLWEGAYGWRAWRRYRAAVDGDDTEEENKLRECNVLVEVAYHCVRERGLSLQFGWLKRRSGRAG